MNNVCTIFTACRMFGYSPPSLIEYDIHRMKNVCTIFTAWRMFVRYSPPSMIEYSLSFFFLLSVQTQPINTIIGRSAVYSWGETWASTTLCDSVYMLAVFHPISLRMWYRPNWSCDFRCHLRTLPTALSPRLGSCRMEHSRWRLHSTLAHDPRTLRKDILDTENSTMQVDANWKSKQIDWI